MELKGPDRKSVGISKEQIALRAMPPAKAEDYVTLAPGASRSTRFPDEGGWLMTLENSPGPLCPPGDLHQRERGEERIRGQ